MGQYTTDQYTDRSWDSGTHGIKEGDRKRKGQLLQRKGKWGFIKKLPSKTKPGRGVVIIIAYY